MAIMEKDLVNTVIKTISVDEFEPKTGELEKVMVVGFFVINNGPGDDLYQFINNSIIEIRDVEVSPNPNEDNKYMVFVEIDRLDDSFETFKELVKEVELVTGSLDWQVQTILYDEPLSINDPSLEQYIQSTPGQFLSREEFNELHAPEEDPVDQEQVMQDEISKTTESIMRFLKDTTLLEAAIDDSILTIGDTRGRVSLEVVKFGRGRQLMREDKKLSEAAIRTDYDRQLFEKLQRMLGALDVLQLDEYIVIVNPATEKMLVTKAT